MIKQLYLDGFGLLDNLKLINVQLGKPRPGEAKIAVKASALNRDQLSYIRGIGVEHNFDPAQKGSLLGYEGAGVVLEVGDGVDTKWIGKEVFPVGPFDVYRYGTLGEEAFVPANRLVEKPAQLSFIEATAVWVPFLTAYALVGQLHIGETILIPAANSAVGLAAIQVALHLGANVLPLVRNAKNSERIKELTSLSTILVDSITLEKDIDTITKGKGIDVVFDPIGSSFLKTAARIAAPGGRIIEYGILGGLHADFPTAEVIGKGLTIKGFTISQVVNNSESFTAAKKFVIEGLLAGKFSPRVAKKFVFEEYDKAFDLLIKGSEIGRIVIDFD